MALNPSNTFERNADIVGLKLEEVMSAAELRDAIEFVLMKDEALFAPRLAGMRAKYIHGEIALGRTAVNGRILPVDGKSRDRVNRELRNLVKAGRIKNIKTWGGRALYATVAAAEAVDKEREEFRYRKNLDTATRVANQLAAIDGWGEVDVMEILQKEGLLR